MADENEVQMNANPQPDAGVNSQASMNQGVPGLVKVISVLFYIGAVIVVLVGIAAIFGASFMGVFVEQIPGLGALGALGVGVFIVLGLVFIGVGVLEYFIGRGLWKAKSWARTIAIIFSVLGLLMAILSLMGGNVISILSLLLNGTIGGYLIFSKEVKAAFA